MVSFLSSLRSSTPFSIDQNKLNNLSRGSPYDRLCQSITCVTLAKAGLVMGLSPMCNTFGCLVCVICNSKSFHSFLFILSHIEDVRAPSILCTFHDFFCLFLRGVELKTFSFKNAWRVPDLRNL